MTDPSGGAPDGATSCTGPFKGSIAGLFRGRKKEEAAQSINAVLTFLKMSHKQDPEAQHKRPIEQFGLKDRHSKQTYDEKEMEESWQEGSPGGWTGQLGH